MSKYIDAKELCKVILEYGKDIFTGKVTHHDVVTYDGWNIPGVKYWMPCPKIPEE